MMQTITLLFTVTSLLLTTNVNAGHHNKPGHSNKPYQQRGAVFYQEMLASVGLSEAQQQQLQQLLIEHRANKPDGKPANKERNALRALVQADHFDDVAVTEQVQQRQQQQVLQRVAQLKLRHQVYQLLSPEQREQLAVQQQQRKQNRQQKRTVASNQ
jgi:protein CpxP